MRKNIIKASLVMVAMFLAVTSVSAHAIVKPSTVGVGTVTDFTLGVPSEKDGVSTVSIRLMLPAGLEMISPVVKAGWRVEVKQGPVPAGVTLAPDDDGNVPTMMPTEIDWTGGTIPSGQKDFFMFSTQVPAQPTELDWKVVQTYSDGTTVSWTIGSPDQQPKDKDGKPDFTAFGPYSKTMVVNDLIATPAPTTQSSGSSSMIAISALILSLIGIGWQFVKRS